LIIFIGGSILFALQQHAATQPGRDLAHRFSALGTLSGKTKEEIITSVGQPSSFSAMANGKSLLQWQATGYHIALLFDGDLCEGVTHEYLSGN
jgi:hypothetical protein